MKRQIYVNLAVQDLNRSMDFFKKLGFAFNPEFTDEKAACMIVNEDAYVMLLSEPFFKTFTHKERCDTTKQTEALLVLSCKDREEVDALVQTAVASGGSHALESKDYGFMYGWSFYDPDGHHWEVLHMDMSAIPAGSAN